MEDERAHVGVERRIAMLAARQHGVISHRQLRELGVGAKAIDYRVRLSRLHPVHRGVYAVGHRHLDVRGRWRGATLAGGPAAVLSHRSAAALWAVRPSASARIEVTVGRRGSRANSHGLLIYRSASLLAWEVTRREGIPVTTVARTLVDLAGVVRATPLARAVERSEQLELFDRRAIEAVLAAHPTRRGTRALAALLADWSQGLITRSDLERDMYLLCDAHDLPRPSVNSPVGPYEADFAWRAQRLIVEVDTYRYHGTRPAFERDRARDAGLTAAGWRVVRFTDRQIHGDPAAVGAVLARLVSARRA